MKVVDFFAHTEDGQIVMVGQCPERDIHLQEFPGATI